VLHLVVQPAVEEIDQVSSCCKVGRGNDLTQEERSGLGPASHVKSVQVISGMVGSDDDKGVDVGKHIGQEQVTNSVQIPDGRVGRAKVHAQGQKRKRQDKESVDEVGQEDTGHEVTQSDPGRKFRSTKGHRGESKRLVRVEGLLLQKLRVGLSDFLDTQLLEGVGCVVPPLPDAHDNVSSHVLDSHGSLDRAQKVHVTFHNVGVRVLAQVVMVQIVMLNIPCLGKHPVHPVQESAPQTSNGKFEAVESARFLAVIVSAVARVVGNHGPTSGSSDGQADGRQQKVSRESHAYDTNKGEHVRPHDHLVQVLHIIGSLLIGQSLAEFLDVFTECFQVHFVNPFIFLRQQSLAALGRRDIFVIIVGNVAFTGSHGGLNLDYF